VVVRENKQCEYSISEGSIQSPHCKETKDLDCPESSDKASGL
jgi:hypothetical protein